MPAAPEKMGSQPPRMMRDSVESSGGVDPREGTRSNQLSRCNRGKSCRAMVLLQRTKFFCRPFGFRKRRGDLG